MTAVTADVVAVDLIANDNQYTARLGNARRAFLGFAGDAESGMRRVDTATGAALRNSASGTALFAGAVSRLLPLLSVGALVGFAKALLDIGDRLGDTAAQLGITTQELQGLDYAARVSGASSERLQQALSILTDNLGDAQKGEGELAKYMRANRMEMGETMDVLYDIADRVKNATTAQEKMTIATTALGRSGRTMVSFLNQGADGLRALQAEAQRKGQIWDPETVARLDSAKDAFETLEKAVVNIAALPASAFINDLSGMLDAIASGNWEAGLEKLARLLPVIAGAGVTGAMGFAVGGPVGAMAGAAIGGGLGAMIESRLPGAQASARPSAAPAGARRGVPLSAQALQQAAKEHADILNLVADRETDALKATNATADARRDAIRAEDAALLQQRAGYADFYDWQQDIIRELAQLDIQSANDRRDADLAALAAREQADLARLKELHATAAERGQVEQTYAEQRTSIEQTAALQIVTINKKKNADLKQADEDWNQAHARAIQLNDGIRDSLESVGLAARRGFGSLKDAAKTAMDQVIDLIFQMTVLRPLLDMISGRKGTTGGGILGSLLSAIPGFATGTSSAPGGLAWVGERGKELVSLPKGSEVVPNHALSSLAVPEMGGASGGGARQVVQNFDLRGAVVTERLYEDMQNAAAQHAASAVQTFNDAYLPGRVKQLVNDPRLA